MLVVNNWFECGDNSGLAFNVQRQIRFKSRGLKFSRTAHAFVPNYYCKLIYFEVVIIFHILVFVFFLS